MGWFVKGLDRKTFQMYIDCTEREDMNFSNLTKEEKAVVEWQYGYCGGFYKSLWQAISTADSNHLNRLEMGFPVEVGGYRRFIGERG